LEHGGAHVFGMNILASGHTLLERRQNHGSVCKIPGENGSIDWDYIGAWAACGRGGAAALAGAGASPAAARGGGAGHHRWDLPARAPAAVSSYFFLIFLPSL